MTSLVRKVCPLSAGQMVRFEESLPLVPLSPSFACESFAAAEVGDVEPLQPLCSLSQSRIFVSGRWLVVEALSRGGLRQFRSF